MKKLFFAGGIISFLVFALPLSAQVMISEIMYDAPGTDAGYEWIEVHNTSQEPVDIAEWRFRENETDHYLSLEFGNTSVINAGGYAVIASDTAKFLASQSGFSGILFDSVFSLINQGESLELIAEDQVIDSIYYTPQDGANGTGASLQYINALWVASMATPGQANEMTSVENPDATTGGSGGDGANEISGQIVTTQSTAKKKNEPFEPYYSGTLTMDPVLLAGTPIEIDFEMLYYRQEDKKPIIKHGGTFIWNMGDGHEFVQDWEDEFFYVYEYPGTYTLYISYIRSSLETEANYIFQKNIKIEKADIQIGMVDSNGSIRIDNKTGKDIDMSGWSIRYTDKTYTLPDNTMIPSGEQRFIVSTIHTFTHLFAESYLPIELVRPTGEIHQKQIVREIEKKDILPENGMVLDTEPEKVEEIHNVSIVDVQEKTKTPDMIIWGIGGASVISLMASILIAFKVGQKKEEVILQA